MPVDNELYDRMADTWWHEQGFLYGLKATNPVRFGYMKRVLLEEFGIALAGKKTLDIGCGGGLLAEEFARMGCDVTGLDPSEKSLEAAREHAAQSGLTIEYRLGEGERLPFEDGTFDIVYCCDVLEHVNDLRQVISETGRVLKPGAVYLYNTINRTFKSKFVMIKLLQEWSWTSFMPPDLHDWNMFIRPGELVSLLSEHGMENRGLRGIVSRTNPVAIIRTLRALKKGRISFAESNREMNFEEDDDPSVMFMGYAVKSSSET